MIIPIKCFTCGKVIADTYRFYVQAVAQEKMSRSEDHQNRMSYLTKDNAQKTIEAHVMDTLNIRSMCCRRHFLTHVDIIPQLH